MAKKKRRSLGVGSGILAVLLLFFIIYIVGVFYFNNHFLFRTKVNNIDVSLMDKEIAQKTLSLSDYNLEVLQKDLSGNDKDEYLNINEAGTKLEFDVSNLLKEQNNIFWFTSLFRNNNLACNDVTGTYDKDNIKYLVDKLYCLQEINTVKPKDAAIVLEGNELKLIEAHDGLQIDKDKVVEKVINCLDNLLSGSKNNVVDLRNDYNKASIPSSSLTHDYENMKKVLDKTITINISNNYQTFIEKNKIIELLELNNNKFEVNYDNLKTYIDSLVKQYPNSDESYYMNTEALSKLLSDNLLLDYDSIIKVEWLKTKKGNTYIDVDISDQTLYFYVDGEVVMSSPVVTGAQDSGTPKGTYEIQRKVADTTLKGADYTEHVDYWIGWDYDTGGRLYGFHDASWRDSFGGDIYLTDGSHGCVNMPLSKVRYLYENAEMGTKVIIHD